MKIIDKIKQIEKYICENFEEWDLEDPVEEEYLVDYHEISGASETEIVSFEKKIGITLPNDVKEIYKYKNGSKYLSIFPCIIDEREMPFCLMSLQDIENTKEYFQNKDVLLTELNEYFSKDELYNLFYNTCKRAITLGAVKIFLYCNSLSSSVDYEKVAKDLNIEIITPLETYKNLPPYCKNIIILSANGVSSYTIDNIIHKYNKDVNTISIGNMSIVESIEEKKSPKQIIDELNLQGFIKYLENINHPKYKTDTLILGCTHFPYLKNEIKLLTKLNIIDASDDMIRRL